MERKKLVYGIDFGTSNSAVAILDGNGHSQILKIGDTDSGLTIRSVLFFPENNPGEVYIGERAILEYVKSGAKGRFIQSIKSTLSCKSFSGTIIPGFGALTSEDLISFILKIIKEKADAITSYDVKRVILGRPAKFSDDEEADKLAEKRLFAAAKKAGFEEIRFQLEPVAAALHHESGLIKEQLVFVADIGGGTSDFTIARLSPSKVNKDNRHEDILSFDGVYIGGDTFDSDIMKHKLLTYFGYGSELKTQTNKILPFPTQILYKLCKWENIGFIKNRNTALLLKRLHFESTNKEAILRLQSIINEDLLFHLFREIERTKISLSTLTEASINFSQSVINIREVIARSEFENFIIEKLKTIEESTDNALRMANINPSEIETVFLTGGSSLIPAIRDLFIKKFGVEKIAPSNAFISVASGLALSTNLFFNE